jgi:hypothetical protein
MSGILTTGARLTNCLVALASRRPALHVVPVRRDDLAGGRPAGRQRYKSRVSRAATSRPLLLLMAPPGSAVPMVELVKHG